MNGDFGRQIVNFPTPWVFSARAKGFPWEVCNGGGAQETRVMSLSEGGMSLTLCTFFNTQ